MTGLDALVCDLDGVLYRGSHAVPGAGTALRTLAAAGVDLHFVTNNATKTPAEAAAKIAAVTGFEAEPNMVVTSALAAVHLLGDGTPPTLLFGAAGAREALLARGVPLVDDWHDAEVVITGLDPDLSYESLTRTVLAVRNGARFIATNTDATYPTPEGLAPGAGALVAAVVAGSGVEPEVAGKPEPAMRRLLAERVNGSRVAVVGDRPETDLALGHAEGWETILVLTGVTGRGDPVVPPPTHVVDSIADVPALYGLS
ncbi:MAG: HAD-IIA family hydrolase [Acidimicrobiia bacterium]|nr:HAD-IIA family hydrolase [Acidimicrobiia bacterium]NNL69096.1 HAD-IIA family hydrolase [Acidimicrobiia bacterium]